MKTKRVKPDPPVREDGRCARPGCNKARKMPEPQMYRRHAEADPFCTTVCCRTYHNA